MSESTGQHTASMESQSESAQPLPQTDTREWKSLRKGVVAASICAGISFVVYWNMAAPDLTWEHQGADGGDLLAAAVSGGVPHPSGYPLYTILLQIWLTIASVLAPAATPARAGNLLSAALAAASVACTVMVVGLLVDTDRAKWWLAATVGMLWAVSPLLWSQALITEVYAFHVLLVAMLVWAALLVPARWALLAVLIGLGVANHLTFVLVVPSVIYLVHRGGVSFKSWHMPATIGLAAGVAGLFYLRIPLAASGDTFPPPVNWGYADNWRGFWWLVSGEAYRFYFFEGTRNDFVLRVVAWARTIADQYTAIGLLIAAAGLASWDRTRPELRNFALLLGIPLSLYAILYATHDSQVYLLPVAWLMAVMIAVGVVAAMELVHRHLGVRRGTGLVSGSALVLVGALTLAAVRAPHFTLRHDNAVKTMLDKVNETVEPGSIVVSSGDQYTFALWYGAWASGELLDSAPDLVLVNDALYQFDWYRRLLGDLYPNVAGIAEGFSEMLAQNWEIRPIYFVEQLDSVPKINQEPIGPIWRYVP